MEINSQRFAKHHGNFNQSKMVEQTSEAYTLQVDSGSYEGGLQESVT